MKKADFLVPIACNFMFLVVAALAFSNNRGLLFSGLDGNYLLTLARFQFDWLPIAFGFFANPLQGMGDMSFAFNAWLHPGYLVPYLFLGMPKTFGVAYEVAVYVTHAICCFLSTQIF